MRFDYYRERRARDELEVGIYIYGVPLASALQAAKAGTVFLSLVLTLWRVDLPAE